MNRLSVIDRTDTSSTVSTPRRAERLLDRRVLRRSGWGFAVAVVAGLLFAFVRHSLIDDAYITLSYARNLAFDGHWGLTLHGTTNTATSPLNVLALAAGTLVLRGPVLALGALFVLCSVTIWYCLSRVAERVGLPRWYGLLAVAFILVNPLLISSIGLEVMLGAALTSVLLMVSTERRPVLFGIVAGLLVLTRVDLGIAAAIVFVARRGAWQGWWKTVLAALAVMLPWFTFSWLVLGSAVPDTLFIKTEQASWGGIEFTDGWQAYLFGYPGVTVWSFVPALLGLAALVAWAVLRRIQPRPQLTRLDALAPLGVAGVVHYAAYSSLGVPPYHWYYGTSIVLLTLFLAGGVAALFTAPGTRALPRAAAGVLAVLVIGASVGAVARNMEPLTYAPITTNWASSQQYSHIGTEVGELVGDGTVYSGGEIGVLAFFCHCAIVDQFADRGYAPELIEQVKQDASPFGKAIIDFNFLHLDKNVQPEQLDFALQHVDAPDPQAIANWHVYSPWVGEGYVRLIPVEN